jgi:hypothetical protein
MGVRTPEVRMQRWAPGALIGLVMGDAFMEPQLLAELSEEKLSIAKIKRKDCQTCVHCGVFDGSAPPPARSSCLSPAPVPYPAVDPQDFCCETEPIESAEFAGDCRHVE